jgi:hypothetical protein
MEGDAASGAAGRRLLCLALALALLSGGCVREAPRRSLLGLDVPENYSVYSASRSSSQVGGNMGSCNLTIVRGTVVSASCESQGTSLAGGGRKLCLYNGTAWASGGCESSYMGVFNNKSCVCDYDYYLKETYLPNYTLEILGNRTMADPAADGCYAYGSKGFTWISICLFRGQVSAYKALEYRSSEVWFRTDLQPAICALDSAPAEYVENYCNGSRGFLDV